MRNKCLFALGVVFAMSLTSIVAFAFSFTGEPDVKNDQQQIVVVNPATESEETTSEQTVSAETEDTTATLQSAGSSLSGSMDWDAEDAYMLANEKTVTEEELAILDGQIKKAELNDAELVPIMKEIRNALGAYREKAGD